MTTDALDEEVGEDELVLQPRCIFCDLEHYVLNVSFVSRGQSRCHNCGRVPPVFTNVEDYRAALTALRTRQPQPGDGRREGGRFRSR